MKLLTFLFGSRSPKVHEAPVVRNRLARAHPRVTRQPHKTTDKAALAQVYLMCGPRVARHIARSMAKNSPTEDHTCPKNEVSPLY